jgi:hypothetical protein
LSAATGWFGRKHNSAECRFDECRGASGLPTLNKLKFESCTTIETDATTFTKKHLCQWRFFQLNYGPSYPKEFTANSSTKMLQ